MATVVKTDIRLNHSQIRKLTGAPTGQVGKAFYKFAKETEQIAKRNVSGIMANDKTGRLRDSIQAYVVPTGRTGFIAGVRATAPYALWVHEGTQPHVIRPVRAKWLRFWWEVYGGIVYFKRVNHPGIQRPRPFLEAAMLLALARAGVYRGSKTVRRSRRR